MPQLLAQLASGSGSGSGSAARKQQPRALLPAPSTAQEQQQQCCASCWKQAPAQDLRRCARCKSVVYCWCGGVLHEK